MKKFFALIIVIISIFSISCINDSSGNDKKQAPALQGESIVIDRFAVMYWKPEWGYGNGQTKYYLAIEVNLETYNRYRKNETIPTEDLIDPNLSPYIPDGTEQIAFFEAPN